MLYFGFHMARRSGIDHAPGPLGYGTPAPNFTLQTLDGKNLSLADLKGKAVVVNFWATWCGPCKIETPWLVELQNEYGAQGLQVVGVAMDDSGKDEIEKFAKDMGVNYPVLIGKEAVGDAYGGVPALPESFFVSRDGKIVDRIIGLKGRAEIEDAVKKALSHTGRRRPNGHYTFGGAGSELAIESRSTRVYHLIEGVRASETMISPNRLSQFAFLVLLSASSARAQLGKSPSVSIAPVPTVTAARATQTKVPLNFRVGSGFHINSNTPRSEFLIPTALKMDLPTDIVLGKIEYPPGKDLVFPFSPDEKLNVYSGDFTVNVTVHPLSSVSPGKYLMRGVLRYQACDNAQCFPPKTLPVSFEVRVVKGPSAQHSNPAQSPHIHN